MRGGNARILLVLAAVLVGLASGCVARQHPVELVNYRARPMHADERLEKVAFVATIVTRGFNDRQLVYRVRLYDRNRRPVISRDGRYQMEDGTVSASRTFMVLQLNQIFRDFRVTIPAEELELSEELLPAIVRAEVRDVQGNTLAARNYRLPLTSMMDARPPMAASAPPEVATFWFIPSADPEMPVLLGPYEEPEEAMRAVGDPTQPPQSYSEQDILWFLPWRNSDGDGAWLGPFATLPEAHHAADVLRDAFLLRPEALQPTEVPLGEALPNRAPFPLP